jgi:hypothetical protein
MQRLRHFWHAFKDVAIIFSFVVNFVLVAALLVVTVPAIRGALALKTGMVEPLLNDLDAAFVGLGESTIDTTIDIEQTTPISFTLPLSEPLTIDFMLEIAQNTDVVLQESVPLSGVPAQFSLPGGGGMINGSVSLALPVGMRLPVRLDMQVPVSKTIPVRMEVPVDQQVDIAMDVPVEIRLGEAGLDPAVEDLRAVFRPLRERIEQLPDGLELGRR